MNALLDGTPTEVWLDPAVDAVFGEPNVAKRNIRSVLLPADRLIRDFRQLREAAPRSGWWPVLVGGPDQSEYVRQSCFLEVDKPRAVSDVLAEAAAIDAGDWLRRREISWIEQCKQDERLQQTFDELRQSETLWPEHGVDRSDQLLEESCVHHWTRGASGVILLIPCGDPWDIPAYLNFGGWNDIPSPEEQTSLWRHWHDCWGATIMAVGESELCGLVSELPAKRDDAIELAWQHFYYDNDAMTADGAFLADTIPELARLRMSYPVWKFWWD